MLLEFIQEDGKKLELTEHALEHVLKGNFVVRPMKIWKFLVVGSTHVKRGLILEIAMKKS